jgi:hypothetical protein
MYACCRVARNAVAGPFAKIASIIKKIKTETVKTQTTHARLRSFLPVLRQKTKRKKKKKKCSQRKKTFPPSLV